jgi:microcystin-dependent protein
VAVVTTAGTYTPPGGTAVTAVAGDQFLSSGTAWIQLQTGFRAPYATTSTAGIVRLATVPQVQALSDNSLAVTPFSLSGMIGSTLQTGFVQLATTAEALALSDTTKVLTPATLGAVSASTTQRGIVQLDDTLTSTSVTTAPTARALKEAYDSTMHKDIIQANGDLIVGFAPSDPQILSRGSNGQVLTVDVTQPLGVKWRTPTVPQAVPIGSMCWFTTSDPAKLPVGWLICDGSAYVIDSTNEFYDLYLVVGTVFNAGGDPAGIFRTPDLRGQFVRGWNASGGNNGTLDPGRVFGSTQTSAYQQHSHAITDPGHCHSITDPGHIHTVTDPGHSHTVNDPGHVHAWNAVISTVVGGSDGLFRGDGKIGNSGTRFTTSNTAGLTVNNCTTGVVVDCASTGITETLSCVTAISVLNSPTLAPTPNETRPTNLALLPILKYKEP